MGTSPTCFWRTGRQHRSWRLALLGLAIAMPLAQPALACPDPSLHEQSAADLSLPAGVGQQAILKESWEAYRQRFIQADGRVIDREANDRTVSEGQAYAMLRAVMIDDPGTFRRTYEWAKANLSRRDETGQPQDHLWAWKWGQQESGSWGIIDANFATDADIDAATALILAARRWNCPTYLEEAQSLLNDIWDQAVVTLPDGTPQLLPGPQDAFWPQPDTLILNPSYFSPYAYRLFAQIDPDHDWQGLIDSGYAMLTESADLSTAGLPSDWVAYNPMTGTYRALNNEFGLTSRYSFDAFRVWWRLALDASWFHEPRASAYLKRHLQGLSDRWQEDQRLAASIGLTGQDLVDYEATSQYAMLYVAWQETDPALAREVYEQKLMATYKDGFWDNDTAYYTQNLAWFGLLSAPPAPTWVMAKPVPDRSRLGARPEHPLRSDRW